MKRFLFPSNKVVFGVALLSTSLLLGCARGSRPTPMFGEAAGSGSVMVTIQNNDFKDATIYANWQGMARQRVGLAIGKTSQTFIIEWRADVVQFDADFIAGGRFPFDPIQVYEGDHLDLVIMNEG